MTCVLQSRDKLLVCVTGWMTAAVGLNALCKFYIRELHVVNSIKRTPWTRLQSFLASKKNPRLSWIAVYCYNIHTAWLPDHNFKPINLPLTSASHSSAIFINISCYFFIHVLLPKLTSFHTFTKIL